MSAFEKLPGEIDHLIHELMSQNLFGNDLVGITQYTIWCAIATLIMFLVIFAAKKRLALVPQGRFVNMVEYIFEYVRAEIVDGVIGPGGRKHLPFIMSIFVLIMFNNVMGMIPGGKPGVGTMGMTLALALVSFIYFIYFGIKKHGVFGYLKTMVPKGIVFPINVLVFVIELFSTALRLLTLAVRLFGNLFAGHIALGTFAILTSLFIQPLIQEFTAGHVLGALPSIGWFFILFVIYLVEILVGFIQAYVFTILSAAYIQMATSDEH